MGRSNVDKAYDHIKGIERSYPDWPSTFGKCLNSNCEKSARGCGLCADCHEEKLSEYVGVDLARLFHHSVKVRSLVYVNMVTTIRNKDKE